MLPWLQEQGTVSTRVMADRFGLTVDELIADLTLASLCGVSEDPRDLIDLWVDEDEVHFGVPKYFERPLRLTLPEAFSLLAAAEASRQIARQVGGPADDDALARAMAKVASAVGPRSDGLTVDIEAPESVRILGEAASAGRVVVIDYWNVDSGESRPRSIRPVEVFVERDHWYVRSVDVGIDAERIFRVDRIESVRVTDEVRSHSLPPRGRWFSGSADSVTVLLAVDPAFSWVLEGYPSVSAASAPQGADVPADWSVVSVVTTGERWLQRLLLRLGSHARLLEPVGWRSLSAETAALVAARYASSTS